MIAGDTNPLVELADSNVAALLAALGLDPVRTPNTGGPSDGLRVVWRADPCRLPLAARRGSARTLIATARGSPLEGPDEWAIAFVLPVAERMSIARPCY